VRVHMHVCVSVWALSRGEKGEEGSMCGSVGWVWVWEGVCVCLCM